MRHDESNQGLRALDMSASVCIPDGGIGEGRSTGYRATQHTQDVGTFDVNHMGEAVRCNQLSVNQVYPSQNTVQTFKVDLRKP